MHFCGSDIIAATMKGFCVTTRLPAAPTSFYFANLLPYFGLCVSAQKTREDTTAIESFNP